MTNFVPTTDKTIRIALRAKLDKKYQKRRDTKIIEELGITHGEARVDIAVVNGVIHGYELKSDLDTLMRLPYQMKIYNSVLDRITLIVGKNHLHDAMNLVPDWWGITIAKADLKHTISFCKIREAEENPSQDSMAVASLLWREEALSILEEYGQAVGVRSKPRIIIYKRLVEALGHQSLCDKVRAQLRTRVGWRSDLQYMPSDG